MTESVATASRYHRLRVQAVIDETADTRSVVLDIPPELATVFRYRPGQFLTLRLPVAGRYLPRCYSMSSAPSLDAAPRVTVKRVRDGRGSNWVCDHVRVGDTIEVAPPAGVFTPRHLAGDFLLFAGGSGITPVFSILREALQQDQSRITLIYANRDERSVIFRDALNALAKDHPERLQIIHWLDSVQGIPRATSLTELVRHRPVSQAFICGPGAFMDAAVAALQALGLADDDVHVERFVSLPEEDAVPLAETGPNAAPPPADVLTQDAEVHLRLDGQEHRLHCGSHETLLEAAMRAGLAAPYSCQAGLCAACMCQVKEGSVHLRHNEALDSKDLAKSWTLACQAVPTSPTLRIQFPE